MRGAAVIGIGNRDRGDDAAGPAVLDSLRGRVPEDVAILEIGNDPLMLVDRWREFAKVILVDAVRTGAPPGTVHLFDARSLPPSLGSGAASTHGFGVREAIALGEALGTLPPVLMVLGIEAASFAPGSGLSQDVRRAVKSAAVMALAHCRTPAAHPADH